MFGAWQWLLATLLVIVVVAFAACLNDDLKNCLFVNLGIGAFSFVIYRALPSIFAFIIAMNLKGGESGSRNF